VSLASLSVDEAVKSVRHSPVGEPWRAPALVDPESREWLASLRAEGTTRDEAVARLHALLLRAARFEVARRRPTLPPCAATSSTISPSRRRTTP
jgi:hypothetical protein